MKIRAALLIFITLITCSVAGADTINLFGVKFQPAVYTKVKNDSLGGTWKQETGMLIAYDDPHKVFSFTQNLGIQYTYPLNLNNKSIWLLGSRFCYYLDRGHIKALGSAKLMPAIYTKTYTNFRGKWNQETGITFNVWAHGQTGLGFNVGFNPSYPIDLHHRNDWTFGLALVEKI